MRGINNGGPEGSHTLTSLLTEMLLEIMKKLRKESYISFVNAKATCSTLRDITSIVKHLSIKQLPMFYEEEYPAVERVIDLSLIFGNPKLCFDMNSCIHSFCATGNFKYGYQIFRNVARKGITMLCMFGPWSSLLIPGAQIIILGPMSLLCGIVSMMKK